MGTLYCIAMYIYLIVSTVMPFSILLAIAKGNKVLAIIDYRGYTTCNCNISSKRIEYSMHSDFNYKL